MEFNKNLRRHVLGLEKNYTSYEIAVLSRFNKNSSFRIYELLKSHIYKSKKSVNNGRVDVEYNISELRFMIGLANSDDAGVKNAMAAMGNNIDWDILYSKLDKKDRKYDTWYDFQRYVIQPAQAELKEKSNVRFEYEGIRTGRKMGRIRFYVYPNTPSDANIIDERTEFIEENARAGRQRQMPRDLPEWQPYYDKYVGHNNLTPEDMDVLVQASGFDGAMIDLAIKQADEQPYIDNYMGWIISCMKAGGYKKKNVADGSQEKADFINTVIDKAHAPETKCRVWERTKQKDDFPEFLDYMYDKKGISFDELDFCYDPEEAIQEYINWRKIK